MSTVASKSQRSSMKKTWRKKEDVSPKKKKGGYTESVLKDSDDLNIAGEELIYHCLFPAVLGLLKSQKIPLSPDSWISATITAVTLLGACCFNVLK